MARLPYDQTVHLTLGTVFNEAFGVLTAAIAGLQELPVNLVVTTGPGVDPARLRVAGPATKGRWTGSHLSSTRSCTATPCT